MSETQITIAATVLAAAAMWLLLPRGRGRGRRLGMLLGLAAVGLLGHLTPRLAIWVLGDGPQGDLPSRITADVIFCTLAGVTVISAAAAVTMRSPVYCAIWFALTLLGTAGLFLYQGAQFLAVATVVVYAGAILVTFLFVLMLAQPEGHSYYDRLSWEAPLSAATGALLVGMLTMTVTTAMSGAAGAAGAATAAELERNVLASQHVAHLGKRLFSEHLIAVEVAGTLLMVALIGAVAIVAAGKRTQSSRRETRHG